MKKKFLLLSLALLPLVVSCASQKGESVVPDNPSGGGGNNNTEPSGGGSGNENDPAPASFDYTVLIKAATQFWLKMRPSI